MPFLSNLMPTAHSTTSGDSVDSLRPRLLGQLAGHLTQDARTMLICVVPLTQGPAGEVGDELGTHRGQLAACARPIRREGRDITREDRDWIFRLGSHDA